MQCFDNGAFYSVTVTRTEVSEFADNWPCSGLNRDRGVTFQFDKRNGDLVDSTDSRNHPHADGSAILALSQDAQAYGCKRLGIENPHAK